MSAADGWRCPGCGQANLAASRFCVTCGGAQPAPPSAPSAPSAAPPRPAIGRGPVIGAAVLILALAALAGWWFVLRPTPVTVYVTRLTHVRSAPTTVGSSVLFDLNRGDTAFGVWVKGADRTTQWLKIDRSDGQAAYAWGPNLAKTARPPLVTHSPPTLKLSSAAIAYAEPRTDAAIATNLRPEDDYQLAGMVSSEWYEVALPRGGVGYVRAFYVNVIMDVVTTVLDQASIRNGPGPAYPTAGQVFPGMQVSVDSKYGDWCMVNSAENQWVECRALQPPDGGWKIGVTVKESCWPSCGD